MSKGLWMCEKKMVSWDKTIPLEDAVKTAKMTTVFEILQKCVW